MTTDLIPWDPTFGDCRWHRLYMERWRQRLMVEWAEEFLRRYRLACEEALRQMADAFRPVISQLSAAFTEIAASLTQALSLFREAGALPPTYAPVGARWTSPLDGTRYRMAKGRGAKKPPHWVEVAPARLR